MGEERVGGKVEVGSRLGEAASFEVLLLVTSRRGPACDLGQTLRVLDVTGNDVWIRRGMYRCLVDTGAHKA